MTDQQLYENSVSMSVLIGRTKIREEVKRFAWLPLAILYEQMIRRKEIEPLSSLPKDKKRKYWDETQGISFVTTERFKRIIVAQSLYVFDLITKE